jgi:hypothetical protein
MGIRESLLNTITAVSSSDFVRIVTSAGASSKATVYNLFKSFESGLGTKSGLTTADYVRVVGTDNVPYKQRIYEVVYKGEFGQIGALPDGNLDNMAENLIYGSWWLNNGSGTIEGTKPASSGQGLLICKRQSNDLFRQVFISVNQSDLKVRYYNYSTGEWTAWVDCGLRTELDALNEKLGAFIKSVNLSAGGTATIDITSTSRGTLILSSVSAAERGMYGYGAASSGSVSGTWLIQPTAVDIATSTNTLTITNNGGSLLTVTKISSQA